jgi:hypothetical protein
MDNYKHLVRAKARKNAVLSRSQMEIHCAIFWLRTMSLSAFVSD